MKYRSYTANCWLKVLFWFVWMVLTFLAVFGTVDFFSKVQNTSVPRYVIAFAVGSICALIIFGGLELRERLSNWLVYGRFASSIPKEEIVLYYLNYHKRRMIGSDE